MRGIILLSLILVGLEVSSTSIAWDTPERAPEYAMDISKRNTIVLVEKILTGNSGAKVAKFKVLKTLKGEVSQKILSCAKMRFFYVITRGVNLVAFDNSPNSKYSFCRGYALPGRSGFYKHVIMAAKEKNLWNLSGDKAYDDLMKYYTYDDLKNKETDSKNNKPLKRQQQKRSQVGNKGQ